MSTCRICKRDDKRMMFKYSTRHWVHGGCGLHRWGAAFLDMIPQHELRSLPLIALQEMNLVKEVLERIKPRIKENE